MPRFVLAPKNGKFYDYFERSVENISAASSRLVDLFDNFENREEKTHAIKKLERDGDEITHKIIETLHLSFVTPIDREDIALLAQRLDDVLDLMEGATKRLSLYNIQKPAPQAIAVTHIINKVVAELNKAIPLLRNHRRLKEILPHCIEIHRLENEADDLHNAALSYLFNKETDVREILKWRDIYQQLERAVDRGEDVANVLEGIVLKYA